MTIHNETMMPESRDIRLKRLRIRSWRRGTREMDLILGPFADAELDRLDEGELAAYENLLEENDQDLYDWFSGRSPAAAAHGAVIARISAFHAIS